MCVGKINVISNIQQYYWIIGSGNLVEFFNSLTNIRNNESPNMEH